MPQDMTDLRGRVALVTGAGSADGIGFAIAKMFHAVGATVVLTSTTNRIFQRQMSWTLSGCAVWRWLPT